MRENQTAILIFTRLLKDEVREKMLHDSHIAKTIQLFENLNRKIKTTVSQTNFPAFVISGDQQKGENFQQRYKNSIQSVFDKGFERVICVGNDSPEITPEIFELIEQNLTKKELVFGKTQRGGIYTLGLTRKGFEALDFEHLPWQTNHLAAAFEKLSSTFCQKGGYQLPQILAELNTAIDLSNFITFIKMDKVSLLLMENLFGLTRSKQFILTETLEEYSEYSNTAFSLRGPPVVAA